MSLLGNILWLIFGGFLAGVGYILGGAALCLSIVGIPFGIQAMKLGVATFAPFGKSVVVNPDGNSVLRVILNILWIILFGWEIAIAHLLSAALLAITIIGIPFALQHIKLIPIALMPLGHALK